MGTTSARRVGATGVKGEVSTSSRGPTGGEPQARPAPPGRGTSFFERRSTPPTLGGRRVGGGETGVTWRGRSWPTRDPSRPWAEVDTTPVHRRPRPPVRPPGARHLSATPSPQDCPLGAGVGSAEPVAGGPRCVESHLPAKGDWCRG